jgi:hypothetical protein
MNGGAAPVANEAREGKARGQGGLLQSRHCEKRSDAAIQCAAVTLADSGLLRSARNDGRSGDSYATVTGTALESNAGTVW